MQGRNFQEKEGNLKYRKKVLRSYKYQNKESTVLREGGRGLLKEKDSGTLGRWGENLVQWKPPRIYEGNPSEDS